MKLPARLADLRGLLQALDWDDLYMAVQREAAARLAIVGPVNSGKSTLFNQMMGRRVSPVTAVPGTTQTALEERFGPFVLVDTPGFGEVGGMDRAEIARRAAEEADVVVLLLDAAAGIRQSDYEIYQSLLATGIPVIVALNKIDLVRRELPAVLEDARRKLGVEPIPVCARSGVGVADRLIPAIVEAHPWIAVALGRALPAYRRQLAERLIRSAATLNGIIAAEPVPGLDVPFLLAGQVRMVLRIAAIYGEPLSVRHAKELLTTIAGGVGLRFLAGQLAKVLPGPGWVIAGVVIGLGTWAIGEVAALYFETGKRLTPAQLRAHYRQIHRRPRRKAVPSERGPSYEETVHP
jgi:small GTP-binding protein